MTTSSPSPGAIDPEPPTADVRGLIGFALESLPLMLRPDGVFCWERVGGDPTPRGRSLRYSLMVLLGLQKARATGYDVPLDIARLEAALLGELDVPELTPGDFGLYLWADTRSGGQHADDLLARLEHSLASNGGLPARVGMELGWIVSGLAEHVAAGGEAARPLLRAALDQLVDRNRGPSGLFRHYGDEGRRRRFPNFATQIYSVLALAQVGAAGLDERALPAARAAAGRLLALQLDDGGWPWVFDVETGGIVERYEIYSVHQHAMAPMGLFALTEATGDARYSGAARRGLDWVYGRNELGAPMIDRTEHLVLRSIRRRAPLSRAFLYANTATALAVGRARAGSGRFVELNRTDRPYSFGWILEAWCGREHLA